MAEFRVSGNIYKRMNEKVFLETKNRIDFKNRYWTRNDFTTKIDIPKEFFKDNFKFDRSTGIYRTELKYSDIMYFIIVETSDSRRLRVRAFNDYTYDKPFINYGVIKMVQGENYTIQPFTSSDRLGEEIPITSKDIVYR